MRKILVLGLLPFFAGCGGSEETTAAAVSVTAQLMMGDKPAGSVTMTQAGENLTMSLTADGLNTGSYGMHIHETGACVAPDYKSAGGHWNPAGKQHGSQNSDGAHAGDLENLVAVDGQASRLERTLSGLTLMGEGGMMDADGAAFVIHAGPDDMKTDPSGDSGGRIICGVFKASE